MCFNSWLKWQESLFLTFTHLTLPACGTLLQYVGVFRKPNPNTSSHSLMLSHQYFGQRKLWPWLPGHPDPICEKCHKPFTEPQSFFIWPVLWHYTDAEWHWTNIPLLSIPSMQICLHNSCFLVCSSVLQSASAISCQSSWVALQNSQLSPKQVTLTQLPRK